VRRGGMQPLRAGMPVCRIGATVREVGVSFGGGGASGVPEPGNPTGHGSVQRVCGDDFLRKLQAGLMCPTGLKSIF